MFSNESTENLLENLEKEVDEPKTFFQFVETKVEIEMVDIPPITKKRNLEQVNPLARRLQHLDKKEKNDENEIIQLSSVSSVSASEDVQKPTVMGKSAEPLFTETYQGNIDEESEEKLSPNRAKVPFKNADLLLIENVNEKNFFPKSKINKELSSVKVIPEKTLKQFNDPKVILRSGSTSQASFEEGATSSSSEESIKTKKKLKKLLKLKDKKKCQDTPSEDSLKADKSISESQSIGIFLHSTGVLKFKPNITSLKVKVSLFNEGTGKQIGDSVTTKDGSFNNDFHNLICTWNELTAFHHDVKRLRENYDGVLVFFEILNSGENDICWAFLKLLPRSFAKTYEKVQLQLFEYRKAQKTFLSLHFNRNKSHTELSVFDQWRMDRQIFPCTLDVSIKVLNQMTENTSPSLEVKPTAQEVVTRKWQKLPGQACKIPNKLFRKIPLDTKGSMNVRWSPDGNLLAFTETTRERTILHVQKFPELREVFTMLEHSDLIHDIDWLRQQASVESRHTFMLTASSDFTAIFWNLAESSYTYNILPHPSFVYACKFIKHEDPKNIQIVTAGRDCVVRIWHNRKKSEGFELMQELNHPNITKASYITVLVTKSSETFFTGSSNGEVLEWTQNTTTKEFYLSRNFRVDEIRGKIITSMDIQPRGNKIFCRVHDYRNPETTSTIFVVGVPTGTVTQRHQQLSADKSAAKLKVTSCGTQLFATNGSVIRVYSLANGNIISSAKSFLNFKIPSTEKICSMDYHPKDFYFACATYGQSGGIVIYSYVDETLDSNLFDKLKVENNLKQVTKTSNTHFTNIIRKLDEVFLMPIENHDEHTFTDDLKRSETYTVSQGPSTYTIQRNQNNTYDIQRKDVSDEDEDETTISESFNQ